jgi:hypothetical protein
MLSATNNTHNLLRMLEQYKEEFSRHTEDAQYESILCRIVRNINKNDVLSNTEYMTMCMSLITSAPASWTQFKTLLSDILAPKDHYDIPISTNSILRNINSMTYIDICRITNDHPDKFASESSKMILGYYLHSYRIDIHHEYISYIFMGMLLSVPKPILIAAKPPMYAKKYHKTLYGVLDRYFSAYETPNFNKDGLITDVVRALVGKKCIIECTMVQYIKKHMQLDEIYRINPDLLTKCERAMCEADIITANAALNSV